MATVIRTVGITGLEGYPIAVQVSVIGGPAVMNIVGLGDQAVKEAKDRIESAFGQLHLKFPKKKIIVNLSPSDDFFSWIHSIPKEILPSLWISWHF